MVSDEMIGHVDRAMMESIHKAGWGNADTSPKRAALIAAIEKLEEKLRCRDLDAKRAFDALDEQWEVVGEFAVEVDNLQKERDDWKTRYEGCDDWQKEHAELGRLVRRMPELLPRSVALFDPHQSSFETIVLTYSAITKRWYVDGVIDDCETEITDGDTPEAALTEALNSK